MKKISASSIFFESLPYSISGETGLVDYDALSKQSMLYRPKLIICGDSAYARDWDYKRFREIADACGAMLMMDMAHISGLVAAKEHNNPFEYCDIVTTTTHKSLRGPRSGLIFFRRGPKMGADGQPTDVNYDLENRINFAVFPSCQGGPHNNTIAGVAVALGDKLKEFGYGLVSDGTDNHLVLWDLRSAGITGSKAEKIMDACHITANKNAVFGDKSAMSPGGIRLGTPALTSRGFKEADFVKVAELLHEAIQLGLKIQATSGKMLKDFAAAIEGDAKPEVEALTAKVHAFARSFPFPGLTPPAAK